MRIESAGLEVRGDRLLVESAVSTHTDEPREQLRIVAVTIGLRAAGGRALADGLAMSPSRAA